MHKFRKRVGLFVILVIISIIFLPNKVNAAQSASSEDKQANSACEKALFNGKEQILNIITNADGSITVNINAKNGIWNVKWYKDNADDFDYSLIFGDKPKPEFPTGECTYTGGSGNYNIVTIPKTKKSQKIFVTAEASGNEENHHLFNKDKKELKVFYKNAEGEKVEETCKAGSIGINKSNKISINGTGAYISRTIPANLSSKTPRRIDRKSEAGQECLAMEEGRYNTDKTKSSEYDLLGNDLESYKSQMKKSFPYCFSGYNSSFDYTAESIKKIRQASIKAYKEYLKFQNAQSDNSKYETALKEIGNKKYKYKYFGYNPDDKKTIINDNLFCSKETSEDTTENYYTRTTEVTNDACEVTCQEQMQVTYGPPVATTAGLCFQYKVTVRSKVTCFTKPKGEIEWPTPPDTCSYTPICGGDASETQAGPNEEFDACINKCDGGKYSQNCINKCYKEVYGEKSKSSSKKVTKTSSQILTNKVLRLTNDSSSDPFYSDSRCNSNDVIIQTKENEQYCANYFYELKQKYPMGYYEKSDGTYDWLKYVWQPCFSNNQKCKDQGINFSVAESSDNSYIEAIKRSSPYYFRSPLDAFSLIRSLHAEDSGYNGFGEKRLYIIDNNGIKRQNSENFKCDEICGYVKDNDLSDDCKNSSKEVEIDMVNKFEKIEADLSKCTSKAVCKDEPPAEFNIKVDYAKEKKDKIETTSWKSTNKPGTSSENIDNKGTGDYKTMFIPIEEDKKNPTANIIFDNKIKYDIDNEPKNGINGICYGRDFAQYWQHYKTTITFPGTWIDLKTGKRVYYTDDYNKETMRKEPNHYCVGYDYKPVNEEWWDWKVNNVGNINKITVEKPNNIKAKITDFGKYNWNVNIGCFYGLSNEVGHPDPKKIPPCEGAECKTTIDNVKVRPIDQADMFAGRTGYQIGFNWTSAAQDKSPTVVGRSYGIDPGAYADELQKAAKSNPNVAYTGPTDYSLHLTKDNIDNLRGYVKDNDGYTSYKGKNNNPSIEKIDGLYYYTSNILEDNNYVSQFKRNTTLGKNND